MRTLCVAVKDASVLFDLLNAGLLEAWFKLEVETHITDFVFEEIQQLAQRQKVEAWISAGLIQVDTLPPGSAKDLEELAALSRELKVSIPDASSVRLAMRLEGAYLVTSDGLLRRGAEKKGLEVRGFLWILDVLVWRDVLSLQKATTALQVVLANYSRQPLPECRRRLEFWAAGEKIRPRDPIPDLPNLLA